MNETIFISITFFGITLYKKLFQIEKEIIYEIKMFKEMKHQIA
jgi:hypothetical protein